MKTITLFLLLLLVTTPIIATAQTRSKTDSEHQNITGPANYVSSDIYDTMDSGEKNKKSGLIPGVIFSTERAILFLQGITCANKHFNDSGFFIYASPVI